MLRVLRALRRVLAVVAVFGWSCGRLGYDLLPSDGESGGSDAGHGATTSGGAAGVGAAGVGAAGGGVGGATGGSGGAATGGQAGAGGPGGSGGENPPDAGAAGSAGAGSAGAADAGPVVDPGPPATCTDTVRNQDETGVDCGGTSCAPCPCSFGVPQLLGNPNNGGSVWSPTLSSDGRTLYVSLGSTGSNEQIAVSTRPDRGNTFGNLAALPSPINTSTEGTPELSADGLSLYFFSARFGGTGNRDLYVATRASTAVQFGAVTELSSVDSSQRDDRPWLSADELTLYFCSQRASSTDDLWRATRAARTDPFGAPAPVTELNSSAHDAGICLTPDAKVALFASSRPGGPGGMDIYRAARASTSDPFSSPELVAALNSSADDFDVQLSPDGQEVFFVSNRNSVNYRIWRALVTCP